jgi:hypothetical protein
MRADEGEFTEFLAARRLAGGESRAYLIEAGLPA